MIWGYIIGVLIAAWFGKVWLSIAGKGLPQGYQSVADAAGWMVFGGLLVWALLLVRAKPELPRPGRPLRAWGWPIVVVAEVALIAFGTREAQSLGHPEWIPVWVLLVVGLHFVPFGWLFQFRGFYWLALAMCTMAVVALVAAVALGGAQTWYVLPGFGGAAILWTTAILALRQLWAKRAANHA